MSKKIHKSRVETFVDTYVSKFSKTNNLREERKFLQKAITMIGFALGIPCCGDPDAVVDYGTPYDNILTNTIRTLLIDIDKKRHKKSLTRAARTLNNLVNNPCCP